MLPSEFKAIKILAEALRAGLSAIKESLQNQEAARKHSEETAKQKLRGNTMALHRFGDPGHKTRASAEAQREQENAHQRVVLRWTRLGLYVSTLIALIYLGTLWEIKSSTDAAVSEATTAQKALVQSEVGTLVQFSIAQQSLQASLDSFNEDQRAWLGLRDFALITFKAEREFHLTALVVNSGKTPALQIREGLRGGDFVPSAWNLAAVTREIDKENSRITMILGPAIPPGGPRYLTLDDPQPLSQPEYDEVLSGSESRLLHGQNGLHRRSAALSMDEILPENHRSRESPLPYGLRSRERHELSKDSRGRN